MRTSLLPSALLLLLCGVLATDAAAQDRSAAPARPARHDGLVDRITRLVDGGRGEDGLPGGGRAAARRAVRKAERAIDRHKVADELGITTTQRDLIKDVHGQHREALQAARQEAQAARAALAATAREPQADAAALSAAGQRVAQAARVLAEQRAAVQAEVDRILTPQQSAGLQAHRAERQAATQGRHDARAERRSARQAARPATGAPR